MRTHEDALAHITEAIEATGVVEDATAEYDLDAIADDLYSAAGGTWQIDDLDTGVFWWVVQRHARDDDEATTPAPQVLCSPVTAFPPRALSTLERLHLYTDNLPS